MAKINYKTQETKKKTERSYVGWIFLLVFILWNVLWVSLWSHEGFIFDWGGAVIISLITLTVGSLFWMTSMDWDYIRTSEYTIFEFELWDTETSQYVKRYDYGSREIFANYFLNWQTGNSETYSTEEDILNRYNDTERFTKVNGYINKEEVYMSYIFHLNTLMLYQITLTMS